MDYVSVNKHAWNERAKVHFDSSFYDVAGFLAGKSSLTEIETAELTDVDGKTLLHLQCHFGLDSLSWARKGAIVTAVDLSDVAIAKANELALQCELKTEFICADVYQFGDQSLPQFTDKQVTDFEIIFTSYGTICWLPCLDRWANIIAKSLKQGGCFYMAEFHPLQDVLEGYSYFHKAEADVVVEGSYTESHGNSASASSPQSTASTPQTMLTWPHSLSDVINALIKAGIRIDSLNEYPFSPYNCFENLIEQAPNQFHSIVKGNSVPLVFTVKGTKV